MHPIAYHVTTERPMHAGQIITFDGTHHSGVYKRVMERLETVRQIYAHPENYDASQLEHHTRVALRELALEEVRKSRYPQYPSRLNSLYVSKSPEAAAQWAQFFVRLGRPTYHIVKVALHGRTFTGDANNCFAAQLSHAENLHLAERYWQNLPNLSGAAVIEETLADGEIEVLEIVREIRENL